MALKLDTLPFETAVIERYRRRESSVEEALIKLSDGTQRGRNGSERSGLLPSENQECTNRRQTTSPADCRLRSENSEAGDTGGECETEIEQYQLSHPGSCEGSTPSSPDLSCSAGLSSRWLPLSL